jgi:hypothetical protein
LPEGNSFLIFWFFLTCTYSTVLKICISLWFLRSMLTLLWKGTIQSHFKSSFSTDCHMFGNVGSRGSEDKNEAVHLFPMRALWALHPVKGHAVSQVMTPGDASKMPQGQ